MEKISALIDKLQELRNSDADLQTLSYYVQLLQAEVLHARNKQHQQQVQQRQSNIAVIMPGQQPVTITPPQTTTLPADKPVVPVNESPEPPVKPAPVAAPQPEPQPITAETRPDVVESKPAPLPPPKEKPVAATLFDQVDAPAAPAPAPAPSEPQQNVNGIRKELNELVGNNGTSLNDHLRQQQVEIAQKLGDMPVKDLKSAIGINDKYQFIQELFRGDTDLYERSVKTINECSSLQEADYWIQREIKIIQGWQDDHHLVQQFYALLRKRFS
ncbi:MAG TPA: hypothetical protein VM802_29165 [Chitinophaga sp.]|uniref:hypothetical protein n=1 Tax=Chitinophaga sp. TaxID=1869181 RepID=UPI002B798A8D|nr:hypothetical protein [Chitinophaga sp.]HVI48972.1 hypothetical protein [Chitinophaga sp.]